MSRIWVYKTELDRYPRDPEFVPDWLREKVERWEVERAPEVALRIAELEAQGLHPPYKRRPAAGKKSRGSELT